MAIHEPESHWWSDIFQTEFRLPQKRYRSLCILPPQYLRVGLGRVANVRRITKALLVKVRGFFCRSSPANSAVSCTDPLEAYVHACIAATFFCYVSPTIYGLTACENDRSVIPRSSQSGDDA